MDDALDSQVAPFHDWVLLFGLVTNISLASKSSGLEYPRQRYRRIEWAPDEILFTLLYWRRNPPVSSCSLRISKQ